MYKAIIIDDEETVRSGLLEHFDWIMHGVQIIAEFPDCAKAYDFIQDNSVDLAVFLCQLRRDIRACLCHQNDSLFHLSLSPRCAGRNASLFWRIFKKR